MATRDRPGDKLIRPGLTDTCTASILARTEAGLLTIRNPDGKITYVVPGPDTRHEQVDISELADANPPCFGLNRLQKRARRRALRRKRRAMRHRS